MQISWIQDNSYQSELTKANSEKLTPLSLNPNEQSAEFVGSSGEIYQTSLADCNCGAINFGYFPCKHMVRLAMELSLLPADKAKTDKDLTLSRLYNRKVEDFIKNASFPEVKSFLHFLQTLDPKSQDFPNYAQSPTLQFLLDTSKPKLKLSKKGKSQLPIYLDLFYKRLGKEFLETGAINTLNYPSDHALS